MTPKEVNEYELRDICKLILAGELTKEQYAKNRNLKYQINA